MFNCYVVILANAPFAYFKTEIAADNFIVLFNSRTNSPSNMKVEGRFIEGISF